MNAAIRPSLAAQPVGAREKKTLRLEMSIEWYPDDPLGVASTKHSIGKLFRALLRPDEARVQIAETCALIDGT